MLCIKCGRQIYPRMLEGADYIKDSKGKWWCIKCTRSTLATAQMYEEMADEPGRYRDGLLKAIPLMVGEELCVNPNKHCKASIDDCIRCWLKYLTGEEMEE